MNPFSTQHSPFNIGRKTISLRDFLDKIKCYPPAETKLPLRHVFLSLFWRNGDFQRALCDYLGVQQCIFANSGRALLSLLLHRLWLNNDKTRNQVLIPGYTCYSVAASVVRAGLEIGVYDLDPKTFDADLDDLRRKINSNTLAVVCQHLFGIPSNLERLTDVAGQNGSYVIEDAAQALGSTIGGRPLGTIGDFGFFSFGRGKPLPLGSGGAMTGKCVDTLPNVTFYNTSRSFFEMAKTSLSQVLSNPYIYWLPEVLPIGLGETVFEPRFRIDGISPNTFSLGERSLTYLETLNEHRRNIAQIYQNTISEKKSIVSLRGTPIYTRFPVLADARPISRELFKFGVRRMYPYAIAGEPTIIPYMKNATAHTPGASEIARRLITLPTHTRISESLAHKIAIKVKGYFEL